MNSAYHRIVYAIAVQDFNNAKFGDAVSNFTEAASLNYTKSLKAPAKYWRAEALYRQGDVEHAIQGYKDFLTSPGSISLDYFNRAYYNIAYAYMSKKDYASADINFRIYIRNEKDLKSPLLNDAYARLADCYFIREQYTAAIENYDKAIATGKHDADYAMFKKAEAFGALGKPSRK